MLEFVWSFINEHSDHPFLVTIFIMAVMFAVAAVAVQRTTGNGVASAFLMVYAIVGTFLGTTGYAVLFSAKLFRKLQRRVGVTA